MADNKRLIDANALKSQITRYHMSLTPRYISKLVYAEIGDVIDIIDEAPTVDAVEVVHGRWVEDTVYDMIACTECGHAWNIIDNCTETFNYCPNCGAKMDGEEDDGQA